LWLPHLSGYQQTSTSYQRCQYLSDEPMSGACASKQ
jgi:hypothetical protein